MHNFQESMEPATLFIIAALVISIVIHEVAHGYMANALGDPTARLAGRLTLNPVRHIDPLGSILIPGFLFLTNAGLLFGWAKPVPYNPYNLKSQRWGEALVAAAGPGVNIILAVFFSIVVRFATTLDVPAPFFEIAGYIVYINILLACFNMIPIPPLDGSKIITALMPLRVELRYKELIGRIEQYGIFATFAFIFIFMYVLWQPFSIVVMKIFQLLTGLQGI